MSLEIHFNEVMDALLGSYSKSSITAKQLIHTIDLTLLDEYATVELLNQLKYSANQNQVAALCVYLQHLSQFSSQNSIDLATVINFPQGIEELADSIASIEKAIQLGAAEIDYVFPYVLYLQGQKEKALNQCQVITQLCKQQKLVLKIILETGSFPDMETIYNTSKQLIELGCDFIKTSTGKTQSGASLSAVFAILCAIREMNTYCGIKISGGIRKPQYAYNYARLAELMLDKQINKSWFRIGASSLLEELLKIN
ncbi:deoxyribose-phosphate aldolase [Legionella parisiensis]|uniref:deoxyribose-phosphate aldolase n=1 Tax=Legionella parisiensis TaxID=45071 RepID=A0A1E5JV53_9GAMM|nr:deoxyribose-phosphate aldolase [Legionella parisiensis]KTD41183.1 2-deoxyribose-5-phosphate aldolase [Legionella parisiensis]OEH48399.1 Deoxyribose-phosphate aldolase [Legionella parisiensis]STX76518.1 2-deoxyribose-5-phosphate aldolase [Legionella parisiensis]